MIGIQFLQNENGLKAIMIWKENSAKSSFNLLDVRSFLDSDSILVIAKDLFGPYAW